MGPSQSAYFTERVPGAAAAKLVPKGTVVTVVFAEVGRAAEAIADWDLDNRVGFGCCGTPKLKELTDFDTEIDINMTEKSSPLLVTSFPSLPKNVGRNVIFSDLLQQLYNDQTPTYIDCWTECRLDNIFRTRECCIECPNVPCALLLNPCGLCFLFFLLLFKPSPLKVNKLERIKSLIAAAKAMDQEVERTADPFWWYCFPGNRLSVSKYFLKLAAKFKIFQELEMLLKDSVHVAPMEITNSMPDLHRYYKYAKIKPQRALDTISHFLLTLTIGKEDWVCWDKEKELKVEEFAENTHYSSLFTDEDFAMLNEFAKQGHAGEFDLPEDWETNHASYGKFASLIARIDQKTLANYNALGADTSYLPKLVKKVYHCLVKAQNVLSYSARIKAARSIASNHSSGKVFDSFGVRAVVSTQSPFACFTECFIAADAILQLPEVHSIAVSHKIRETGWFDFKLIAKFNVAGFPTAEFLIVPDINYVNDADSGGHHDYKAGGGKSGGYGAGERFVPNPLHAGHPAYIADVIPVIQETFNALGQQMER